MKLCDLAPCPPRSIEENLWRAQHFDMMIAKIGDDAQTLRQVSPDTLLLEYIHPNFPNQYNLGLTADKPDSAFLALRLRTYLDEHALDGIFIDTPLDNLPMPVLGVRMVNEIKLACAPKIVMPNFGDHLHWRGLGTNKHAWQALGVLSDWHFVEVAADLSKPFEIEKWRSVTEYAKTQLNLGKHVVLGIYDPPEKAHYHALALMLSFQHERLYWTYKTNAFPAQGSHVSTYGWNSLADAWRNW